MSCPLSLSCDIVECLKIYEKDVRYCVSPDEHKDRLKDDMAKLINEKDVVERIINEHIEFHSRDKCKHTIEKWIREVNKLNGEVEKLLESLSKVEGCRCWFSCNSNRRLGKRTIELITQIEKQHKECPGHNLADLVELATPPRVKDVPGSTFEVKGMEDQISKILGNLKIPNIQIIGIYGVGGVGKTTLMTELNNVILKEETQVFDYIIWVTISHGANTKHIQNKISERMGYDLPDDSDERRKCLFEHLLNGKRFLFLMDDVWSRLDLKDIGIPIPHYQRNCKIIFTTRSLEVCRLMDTQKKIEVQCLEWNHSWELFCVYLGDSVDLNDQCIKNCAEVVAKKCHGLPLALKVISRAVRACTTIREWHDTIQRLDSSPNMIEGVEEELFHILKYSFDNLKSKNLQLCLLYCSLYPEDFDINKFIILDHWMAEGFLDDDNESETSIEHAINKGFSLLSRLREACLIEQSPFGDSHFRLHDIVRDMCLWIANCKHDNENIFEVWNSSQNINEGDCVEEKLKRWGKATKVSWVGSNIQYLGNQVPQCPRLETLLLSNCKRLHKIDYDFFHYLPSLQVLDLRLTTLEEVPTSISHLVQLRYLNLAGTKIGSLPKEVGNLVKLTQLYLYDTPNLSTVPRDALSHLKALKRLEMGRSGYLWKHTQEEVRVGDSFQLKDLLCLETLEVLKMDIRSKHILQYLISNDFFHKRIKFCFLHGTDMHGIEVTKSTRNFSNLGYIHIDSCPNLGNVVFYGCYLIHLEELELTNNRNLRSISLEGEEKSGEATGNIRRLPRWYEAFGNLKTLRIVRCPLRNISSIRQMMSLGSLTVEECRKLTDIVPIDDDKLSTTKESPLQRLRYVFLRHLPNLRNICGFNLSSLSTACVIHCPNLRRLPFKRENCKIVHCVGSEEWRDALIWDSGAPHRLID